MKKFHILGLLIVAALSGFLIVAKPASAVFTNNRIIDDPIFDNWGSMDAGAINNFLNGFPNSCLSTNNGFTAPEPSGFSPSAGFTYGGNVSGGQVIAAAARGYHINPQVILATLEKESSVVSGSASYHCQYINTSMGFDCPDSGSCPQNPATESGFSKQVIHAAWLLRFDEQHAKGNYNYAEIHDSWDNSDDIGRCYSGPMTEGNYKRGSSSSCNQTVFYDGYTTIDGSPVHLDTGATAALYHYTPHMHGNQLFYGIYAQWFGSPNASCANGANVPNAPSGAKVTANRFSANQADRLSITFLNNTGSQCVEIHTWNDNQQSWLSNVATNHVSYNPADGEIVSGNTNGDGKDELFLVKYRNTGSGMIEIHGWDSAYQGWASHVATNHTAVDPADNGVIAADTNGDGKDELFLVKYRNTGSGMIEIHGWDSAYQGWASHVATNHTAVDPADNGVIAADTNGDGKDELFLVKYRNTGSGMIEIHGWDSALQGWASHVITNLGQL